MKLRSLLKRAKPPDRVRRAIWPENQFLRLIKTVDSNWHPERKPTFNRRAWLMRDLGDSCEVVAGMIVDKDKDPYDDWEPYDPASTRALPSV